MGLHPLAVNDAVSGDRGTRIDAEHDHLVASPGLVGLHVAVGGDFLHVVEIFELFEQLHQRLCSRPSTFTRFFGTDAISASLIS